MMRNSRLLLAISLLLFAGGASRGAGGEGQASVKAGTARWGAFAVREAAAVRGPGVPRRAARGAGPRAAAARVRQHDASDPVPADPQLSPGPGGGHDFRELRQ